MESLESFSICHPLALWIWEKCTTVLKLSVFKHVLKKSMECHFMIEGMKTDANINQHQSEFSSLLKEIPYSRVVDTKGIFVAQTSSIWHTKHSLSLSMMHFKVESGEKLLYCCRERGAKLWQKYLPLKTCARFIQKWVEIFSGQNINLSIFPEKKTN